MWRSAACASTNASYVFGMMRRVLLFLVLAAATLAGCASTRVPEPKPPPPASEPRTRVDPPDDQTPKLIAPPPAYGNKVVLARGTSDPGHTKAHLDGD